MNSSSCTVLKIGSHVMNINVVHDYGETLLRFLLQLSVEIPILLCSVYIAIVFLNLTRFEYGCYYGEDKTFKLSRTYLKRVFNCLNFCLEALKEMKLLLQDFGQGIAMIIVTTHCCITVAYEIQIFKASVLN
ncbi:hypothetical protein TcasGA2_TC013271 [Tribolium castaneum]|uniref:Uncharacterized protein n=1 Tax=Tribolium castaneum TaxID=7070 RepID=D6WUE2_TRICA|nr:hypothetical protein TcasGA2_TC013271 [Tribolium castaneum]